MREPTASCAKIAAGRILIWFSFPGIAFDLRGNRLGRGQGFYDRLLGGVHGMKCGIAFDEQVVKKFRLENTDVPVDFILTPTRCVKVAG